MISLLTEVLYVRLAEFVPWNRNWLGMAELDTLKNDEGLRRLVQGSLRRRTRPYPGLLRWRKRLADELHHPPQDLFKTQGSLSHPQMITMSAACKEHGAGKSMDTSVIGACNTLPRPASEARRVLEQQLKQLEAAYAPYRQDHAPKE